MHLIELLILSFFPLKLLVGVGWVTILIIREKLSNPHTQEDEEGVANHLIAAPAG